MKKISNHPLAEHQRSAASRVESEPMTTDAPEAQMAPAAASLLTKAERRFLLHISVQPKSPTTGNQWLIKDHEPKPWMLDLEKRGYVRVSNLRDIWGPTGEKCIALTEAGRAILAGEPMTKEPHSVTFSPTVWRPSATATDCKFPTCKAGTHSRCRRYAGPVSSGTNFPTWPDIHRAPDQISYEATIRGEAPPPGNDPAHALDLPLGYRVVFSLCELGNGLARQFSMSVPAAGRLPSPFAVRELLPLFGMAPFEMCVIWVEGDPAHRAAINVLCGDGRASGTPGIFAPLPADADGVTLGRVCPVCQDPWRAGERTGAFSLGRTPDGEHSPVSICVAHWDCLRPTNGGAKPKEGPQP